MAAPSPAFQTRVVMTRRAGADADTDAIQRALTVEERAPLPQPAPGQLLVRITARPIHPADIMAIKACCLQHRGIASSHRIIEGRTLTRPRNTRQGAYPAATQAPLPAVPGYEGTGVVEDANGVAGWTDGARVHIFCDPRSGQGSWQQYAAAAPEALSRVPDGMREEVAAQSRGNPATALGLLETLAPPPGAWVIQTAAASTLGRMFIGLAKQRGVRTVNVIRSRSGREHQVQELTQLGADVVLAADADDIAARVRELTGGAGAWGAADAVGGEMTQRLMAAVRDGGTVLLYGALAGGTFTGSTMDALGRSVVIKGAELQQTRIAATAA
jgi:NADPH:quinone reductase-like Zn-dependent oxidoreductase